MVILTLYVSPNDLFKTSLPKTEFMEEMIKMLAFKHRDF